MAEKNPGNREWVAAMRQLMRGDDIDDIVRWQLTGLLSRRTPVYRRPPQPRCHRCGGDWHGLPTPDGCEGSFQPVGDTPKD